MRFPKSFPLILAAFLLAGCSSGSNVSNASKEEVTGPTVEQLIAKGCEKYLVNDSKGAQADFAALAKLDATYKEIEAANKDITDTLKGVTTVEAISALPEKVRLRVYESILLMENLCSGVDAP